jgi:hypothetical protein
MSRSDMRDVRLAALNRVPRDRTVSFVLHVYRVFPWPARVAGGADVT